MVSKFESRQINKTEPKLLEAVNLNDSIILNSALLSHIYFQGCIDYFFYFDTILKILACVVSYCLFSHCPILRYLSSTPHFSRSYLQGKYLANKKYIVMSCCF